MANYNTDIDFLEQAINSILNQTYSCFELIIIDDASTNESVAFIQSINDSRIKLLKNDVNQGQPYSRNRGFDEAKGKYIAIMDSDDVSLPNRLETELDFMESHPDVVVCASWFEKFGVENIVRKPVITDMLSYRFQLLFADTPITFCHPTAFFRKDVIDKYNIRYDSVLQKSQDFGMWVVCSKIGRMAIIEEVLLRYRTHDAQISIKGRDSQRYYTNLISRRQLEELGIEESENEDNWRSDIVADRKDYLEYYNWLQKIKTALIEHNWADEIKIEELVSEKIQKALKHIKRIELAKLLVSSNSDTKKIICDLIRNSLRKNVIRKRSLLSD